MNIAADFVVPAITSPSSARRSSSPSGAQYDTSSLEYTAAATSSPSSAATGQPTLFPGGLFSDVPSSADGIGGAGCACA